MSAIAGIVKSDANEHLDTTVEAMCRIQSHRGPHGTSVSSLPGACLGRALLALGLGDRAGSAGPVVDKDAMVAVTFDGILFGRDDLARKLGLDDAASESDGMLVLRSYLKWNSYCAEHLDGIFSFAVWNWKDRVLLAARDRMGEKPFYYHVGPSGELTFASEIKALMKHGRVRRDLDYEAIFHYLHEKGFTSPRTPLAEVSSLQPGYCLEWKNGRITLRPFWDIPHIPEKIDDEERVLATFRELLTGAVRERIIDDAQPGLLFSGGIDSSLLLGMLDSIYPAGIKTFTIVTGSDKLALEFSRSLSLRFGTKHTEIELTAQKIARNLGDLLWYLSTPTVHSILAYFCTSEAQQHGVRSIFSGHMADSIVQSSWLARIAMPAEKLLAPLKLLPRGFRTALYDRGERMLRWTNRTDLPGLSRHFTLLYLYLRRKRGLSQWYGSRSYPDQIARLFDREINRKGWTSPADIYRDLFPLVGSDAMDERNVYTVIKAGAGPSALINYESIAAAFSMQMQTPFLDQQLVEFARSIDVRLRGKEGSGKYILKKLCSDMVSGECAAQAKAGFILPFDTWLRSDLWPIVEETLSPATIRQRGIFDEGRLTALCREYYEGSADLSWVDIWAFVVLEIWMRLHLDSTPGELSRPSGDWSGLISAGG
jgi:asparagine synthase (glutamine-hydrolysing)